MRLSASSSLLLATLAVSAAVVSPHRYHPREVLALANDNKGEHHPRHLAGSTSIASRDLLAELSDLIGCILGEKKCKRSVPLEDEYDDDGGGDHHNVSYDSF